MKAMIFAAGLGTRLRPLTDSLPKALVPLCGKPLLYHVMMRLKSFGYDEIVVNVHHFADMIEQYLLQEGNFGMKVSISDERDLLRETGGGIRHARKWLEEEGSHGMADGSFLVHNVDIISDLDLAWFASECRQGALANLLVSDRKTSRYLLFDRDMRLVGWQNVSTGEVRTPYRGLDPDSCHRLAFSGIHHISDRIFDVMDRYDREAEALGIDPLGERFPIMDFYLKVAADCPIYGVEARNLHLVDVGKLQSLREAEALCSSLL